MRRMFHLPDYRSVSSSHRYKIHQYPTGGHREVRDQSVHYDYDLTQCLKPGAIFANEERTQVIKRALT